MFNLQPLHISSEYHFSPLDIHQDIGVWKFSRWMYQNFICWKKKPDVFWTENSHKLMWEKYFVVISLHDVVQKNEREALFWYQVTVNFHLIHVYPQVLLWLPDMDTCPLCWIFAFVFISQGTFYHFYKETMPCLNEPSCWLLAVQRNYMYWEIHVITLCIYNHNG